MHLKKSFFAGLTMLTSSLLPTLTQAVAETGFTEVDPAEFVIAIEVSKSFQLGTGDADLTINFDEGSTKKSESFTLLVERTNGVIEPTNKDKTMYIGRLESKDYKRVSEFQDYVKAAKQAGKSGTGDVSISITGGCFIGKRPTSLPMSAWIQTEAREGFEGVLTGEDIFDMIDAQTRQKLMKNMRPCK